MTLLLYALSHPSSCALPSPRKCSYRLTSPEPARWVHLPSGRVYNTTYSAPKVPGRDDITGEPLSKRPDDTPVSRLALGSCAAERCACWHSSWPVQETFSKRLQAYYESTAPLLQVSGACDDSSSPISITTNVTRPTIPRLTSLTIPRLWIHKFTSAWQPSGTRSRSIFFPCNSLACHVAYCPRLASFSPVNPLFVVEICPIIASLTAYSPPNLVASSPGPRCLLALLRPCSQLARLRPRRRCFIADSLLAPLSPRPVACSCRFAPNARSCRFAPHARSFRFALADARTRARSTSPGPTPNPYTR